MQPAGPRASRKGVKRIIALERIISRVPKLYDLRKSLDSTGLGAIVGYGACKWPRIASPSRMSNAHPRRTRRPLGFIPVHQAPNSPHRDSGRPGGASVTSFPILCSKIGLVEMSSARVSTWLKANRIPIRSYYCLVSH